MFELSRTFRFEISDDFLRRLLRDGIIEPSFSSSFHDADFLLAARTAGPAPKIYTTLVLARTLQFEISDDFRRLLL